MARLGLLPNHDCKEHIRRLQEGEYGYVTLRLDDGKTMIVADDTGPAGADWKQLRSYCSKHEMRCFFAIFAKEKGGKAAFVTWVPEDCPYAEDRDLYRGNGESLKDYIARELGLTIAIHMQADDPVDLDDEPNLAR